MCWRASLLYAPRLKAPVSSSPRLKAPVSSSLIKRGDPNNRNAMCKDMQLAVEGSQCSIYVLFSCFTPSLYIICIPNMFLIQTCIYAFLLLYSCYLYICIHIYYFYIYIYIYIYVIYSFFVPALYTVCVYNMFMRCIDIDGRCRCRDRCMLYFFFTLASLLFDLSL